MCGKNARKFAIEHHHSNGSSLRSVNPIPTPFLDGLTLSWLERRSQECTKRPEALARGCCEACARQDLLLLLELHSGNSQVPVRTS